MKYGLTSKLTQKLVVICKEGFVCNLLLLWSSCNKSAGKKGKSITGKYYKDTVLKKLKKYYQKRRPATGFKHVRLLHDNAPAHTSAIVTAFLKKEKVTVLPHPPVFLRPCPMWFLFVSEIEIIPCWVEIPIPIGTWICHSSVPYYCA